MPALDAADAFLRIGAAGGCGALIGLERESRNQLAGMRTHALVAAGAAVFTLAGAYGFSDLPRGPNVDPMRVAAQIASGIGFIGAGAIIRDRGSVRGVTTAAALWTSAALGLAAGAGLWWVAAAGAIGTLLVLIGTAAAEHATAHPVRHPSAHDRRRVPEAARRDGPAVRGDPGGRGGARRSQHPRLEWGIHAFGRGRRARA